MRARVQLGKALLHSKAYAKFGSSSRLCWLLLFLFVNVQLEITLRLSVWRPFLLSSMALCVCVSSLLVLLDHMTGHVTIIRCGK